MRVMGKAVKVGFVRAVCKHRPYEHWAYRQVLQWEKKVLEILEEVSCEKVTLRK